MNLHLDATKLWPEKAGGEIVPAFLAPDLREICLVMNLFSILILNHRSHASNNHWYGIKLRDYTQEGQLKPSKEMTLSWTNRS
jgi:hypothetical protein